MARYYVFGLALVLTAVSCHTDDIKPYNLDDAAVVFSSTSTSFSLKGVTEDEVAFTIPITLIGPTTDYDRRIDVAIGRNSETNAVEGEDFEILKSQIDSGATSGVVNILVKNNLTIDVTRKQTVLTLTPNEYFREGYPSYMSSVVSWSEEYVRPKQEVWRYWYTYFSKYYSRNYHELMVEVFGEEIEYATGSQNYASADTTLVYHLPTWWYAATRQFREYIGDYDATHSDPLMHSSDCMYYSSYLVADGAGEVPDEIPTIYETIIVL